MQIIQQHRNIALTFNIQASQSHTKPIDTSKLTTGHFIELRREEIQLHLPEHQCNLPYPGNLDKPLIQPHPQEGTSKQRGTINLQHTERPPQTQQYKQDEKAKKYAAGKGTL